MLADFCIGDRAISRFGEWSFIVEGFSEGKIIAQHPTLDKKILIPPEEYKVDEIRQVLNILSHYE